MINELACFPTRSDNAYFANNEQTSVAVFNPVFCFTHAKYYLIKLKFIIIECEIQRNQSNLLNFKNYPMNQC